MSTPTNKQLREFIITVFDDSELNMFCFDHFEDVDIPVQMGINDKAVMLIKHCKRRALVADLLLALQEARPRQYKHTFALQVKTAKKPAAIATAPAAELTSSVSVEVVEEIVQNENSFIHAKTGMEFVRVWAGDFWYGEDEDKKKIQLPEFWISKTAVTHAVYKRFIDANPQQPVPYGDDDEEDRPYNWNQRQRAFPPDKADHPVVLVSWRDAIAFCTWAGLQLPTEEQWEKAARGGGGRTFPWGNEEPTKKHCDFKRTIGGTTPAGAYSPQGDSPYGCADMSGNVLEWCLNKWGGETVIDDTNDGRVLRGGSWSYITLFVRAAYRVNDDPDDRSSYYGFRVVVRRSPSH